MNIKQANKLLKDYLNMNSGIVGILFESEVIFHLHFTKGENICFQENENEKIQSTLVINSVDKLHLYVREKIICEKCLKDWLFQTDTEIERVFKEIKIPRVLN